ncbi:uncharacterized protein [Rutidosis leptorrhynchoides]|uniref:uncharacterized protein n=1 Tax=Rutidosis leptorrhynchoides TaxID=125765 RepID=UPI003A992A89
MEGLHILLKEGVEAGLFQGASIGRSNFNVSHLFYANDVVIVSDWNSSNMMNVVQILNVFHCASGLKINIEKSNVYGIGVAQSVLDTMANQTGCLAGSLPFKYLGLSLGANMNALRS